MVDPPPLEVSVDRSCVGIVEMELQIPDVETVGGHHNGTQALVGLLGPIGDRIRNRAGEHGGDREAGSVSEVLIYLCLHEGIGLGIWSILEHEAIDDSQIIHQPS